MKPGETIGRFRIEGLLGEGGMGVVYRAHDPRLDRRVALKVLHLEAAEGDRVEGLARILREARSAAALDHPNAVAIFDVGDTEGLAYIAMELVEGVSLRRLIGRTDITIEQRIQWLAEIGRALSAAHDRGLVHRDVKPENVMVRTDGVVKVLDFGIARKMQAGPPSGEPLPSDPLLIRRTLSRLTTDGHVMGTPLYMAPEQVRGAEIDARIDQFSWGIVAYELLSGTLPWKEAAEAVVTIERMLTTDPTPLHSHGLGLPAVVEAVVEKAMARKPADRFASMREIVEALQPFARASARPPELTPAGGARVDAPTERSWQATHRRKRRSPTVLAAAIAAALAVTAAGVIVVRARLAGPPASGSGSAALPSAAPSVTTLLDVPAPSTSSPEAVAAFRAGLAGMRDGNAEGSIRGFQRAVTLDPDMAQAQVRLAVLSFWVGHLAEGREAFARAVQLRARMSDRDGAFLDAIAPWIERFPPDFEESSRRLAALVERWPRDAELRQFHAHLLQDIGEQEQAAAEARELRALDPQCINAYHLAFSTSLFLGDEAGAEQVVTDCERALPSNRVCRRLRARSDQYAGRCPDLERTARDGAMGDPGNPRPYELLAEALAAQGRPHEAVLEVLSQRWARLPMDAKAVELADRARLAMHEGRFDQALDDLDSYERAVADEPDEPPHAIGALLRLAALDESGRAADAGRFAKQYLSRAVAWTHGPAVDGQAIEEDPLPRMLAAEVRAGLVERAELDRRREDWAAAWTGRTRPFFRGYLWFSGWAAAARTRDELRDADAARARFAPIPTYHESLLGVALVGAVDLGANQNGEALAALGRAAASCTSLAFPIEHARATELLGEARERAGDTAGACAAYAQTLGAWGHAVPRSVTADQARARARALSCPVW